MLAKDVSDSLRSTFSPQFTLSIKTIQKMLNFKNNTKKTRMKNKKQILHFIYTYIKRKINTEQKILT